MRDMKKRPNWCPYKDCKNIICYQDLMCCGVLPKPESHDNDFNDKRFCLKDVLPNNEIFDLQINNTDAYWFIKLFEKAKEKTDKLRKE